MKKRIQNVLLLMKNKIGRWRLKIKTERQKIHTVKTALVYRNIGKMNDWMVP